MTRQKPATRGRTAPTGAHAAPATTPPPRKSEALRSKLKPGQLPDEATAELVVAGLGANAVASVKFSAMTYGDVDLTACLNSLVSAAERVNAGDLGDVEALLSAQAATLNAMFVHLIIRAKESQYIDSFERYMRYGMRAQAQCRATLETLAALKNPPTVFARQANIANGPQQVNNTRQLPERSRGRAIPETRPSELLEAYVGRVDAGTAETAVGGNQALEALGVVNGTANRRR